MDSVYADGFGVPLIASRAWPGCPGTGPAAVMACGPRRGGNVHDLLALAGPGAPGIGEVSGARAPCEKLLACASPLLL